jgi:addiction module HigA family antidote
LNGAKESAAMTEYPAEPNPDWPPTHPGEILREDVLPALKMSVKDAAAELGVSRQMLHSILNGTAAVTPEMALRLGKFCGNGPGLWLRMQQARDLWEAERALADELKKIPTHRAA